MDLLTKINSFFTGRKAYDPTFEASGLSVARFFLNRRSLNLTDPTALLEAYAQHELAYACINKIADVMNDAEIVVEQKKGAEWEIIEGHPLTTLFRRPNPHETGRDFRRLMVQSEYASAIFYGEMVRSAAGMPVEIYALNPNKVHPHLNKSNTAVDYYEYRHSDGTVHKIKPENMLIRRRVDLVNRFFGLSPLAVALKTINSDIALTDYVDAFFESDGTPSGILKILNAVIPDAKKEALQAQWRRKYSRGGTNHKGLAVLDQNADYQAIGAKLNELDTGNVSARFESRICSVFGVPPILVGSLVGLTHTTANATAKSALNDFWDNKVSPDLAALREWMTWFLLPQFEDIEKIKADKIRVGYDISQVAFLQEDQDQMHGRARANFLAGLMMLNEAREAIGLEPDDSAKGKDYYVQPNNITVISPERRAEDAIEEPEPPPQLIPAPAGEEGEDQPIVEEEKPVPAKAFPIKELVLKGTVIQPPIEVKKQLIEYEGLLLRREPDHLEKLCDLKSIVNELEINEDRAKKVLRRFRLNLIDQAVEKLDKRSEINAHLIALDPDAKTRKELGKAIRNAYATGQNQVARELMNQKRSRKLEVVDLEFKELDENDLEYIEGLTDGLVGRMINEIRTRAINQYLSFRLLTNYTKDLLRQTLLDQSEKFLDQLAGSAINAAIQSGRADEAQERKDEWDNVQYSAILDSNTCDECAGWDGAEADDPGQLPDTPNPDCEGGANCRCFHVYVAV